MQVIDEEYALQCSICVEGVLQIPSESGYDCWQTVHLSDSHLRHMVSLPSLHERASVDVRKRAMRGIERDAVVWGFAIIVCVCLVEDGLNWR